MSNKSLDKYYNPELYPYKERVSDYVLELSYKDIVTSKRKFIEIVNLKVPTVFNNLIGKRIAYVSDLHYEHKPKNIAIIKDLTDAIKEYSPSLLLIGGDICSYSVNIVDLDILLPQLRECAPKVLSILGNWETTKKWISNKQWKDKFSQYDITLLHNTFYKENQLEIYGLGEINGGNTKLPETWTNNCFHLLLSHRPDTIVYVDDKRENSYLEVVDWALCGHTHGGQIRLPFLGPLYASSRYSTKLSYGLFSHKDMKMQMFVSSGIGEKTFPWRLNCRRELICIEFVKE